MNMIKIVLPIVVFILGFSFISSIYLSASCGHNADYEDQVYKAYCSATLETSEPGLNCTDLRAKIEICRNYVTFTATGVSSKQYDYLNFNKYIAAPIYIIRKTLNIH